MPTFPEQTYEFTRAQDIASQHLAIITRRVLNVTIPGVSDFTGSGTLFTVPRDRVFCCTSFVVIHTPGGAIDDYATGLYLLGSQPGDSGHYFANYNPAWLEATASERTYGWSGEVWIPPGTVLEIYMYLARPGGGAGGASYFLTGFTIPRGNFTEG